VWLVVRPPPGDPRLIPACDSPAAIDLAKRGLSAEPVGTIMGLTIVDMSQFIQQSSSGVERRCVAQARMNDRTMRTARYRIKRDAAGHYSATVDVAAPASETTPR
jgi:predicted transcriptional regulator